jgi:hypothetical protein
MLATNYEHSYSFEIVIFWNVIACRLDTYSEAGAAASTKTMVPITKRHAVTIPKDNNFHSFCHEILVSLFSSYIMFCDDIHAF